MQAICKVKLLNYYGDDDIQSFTYGSLYFNFFFLFYAENVRRLKYYNFFLFANNALLSK